LLNFQKWENENVVLCLAYSNGNKLAPDELLKEVKFSTALIKKNGRCFFGVLKLFDSNAATAISRF
jgi:hypothetical protein